METKELLAYIGSKIKEMRNERGFSQEELGKKMAVSKQAICNYETGRRDAGQDNIFRLAEIFNVPIDYFFPTIINEKKADYNDYDSESLELLNHFDREPELKTLFLEIFRLSKKDKKHIIGMISAQLSRI